MDFSILSQIQINYTAVAVCSLFFFFLGSMWFGVLFGNMWVKELGRHNVFIQQPSTAALCTKMVLNLLKNVVISLAMAYLVALTGSMSVASGLSLGVIVACGIAAPAMADVFIWENRSIKLFYIDSGYQVIGIVLSAVILSVW